MIHHAITMILSMILIQVFAMPYIMAESVDDVYFSVTQGWMGAAMGALMVGAEGLIHPQPLWVWMVAATVLAVAVVGYRYQVGVTDREYLHDMIPHHSMAVLTSEWRMKRTNNPAILRLATSIRDAQVREIAEMRRLLQARTV